MSIVRIVPPPPDENGIVLANGTKVYAEDGTQIRGITGITLTAEVGGIWRAKIECMVRVGEMTAVTEDVPEASHA